MTMTTILNFNKLNERAVLPTKRQEDAGHDFFVQFPKEDKKFEVLYPGDSILMNTGIRSAFNDQFYLQITNKSSVGSKGLITTAGVIDSGYRGEIKIPFFNISTNVIVLIDGDKLSAEDEDIIMGDLRDCYGFDDIIIFRINEKSMAQGILYPIPRVNVVELENDVYESLESERADGGFGSTDNL